MSHHAVADHIVKTLLFSNTHVHVYVSNMTMALHKMWKKEKSMANLMFTTAQCTSANL